MRITSGGCVGIGTTSPSQALHVVGNLFIDDDDTTGNGVMLESADRPLITRGWDPFTSGTKNGIGRWGIYMEAAELFLGCPGTDYTNGLVTIGGWLLDGTRQPNLTVNNYTRNVGIGTTSPGEKLTINGGLGFQYSGTQIWHLNVNSSNNLLFTRSGISDRMVITSDGDVGIGTTSPGTRAEVYRLEGANRTTYTDLLTITAAANTSPYAGHGGGGLFKGTTYVGNYNWGRIGMELTDFSEQRTGENMFFEVAAADNSSTLTRAMTIQYNGNVGIGTTSPGGNLDVRGSATTNVSYFRTSGAANRYILNVQNLENSAQVDFRVHGSTYTETLFGNSMTNASAILGQPASSAVFAVGNYNNGPLVLGTNNSERVRILGNGNVGIGSTAPAFPLDVNGPGRFVSNASSRVLYLVQDSVNAGNIIQFRNQSNTDIGEIVYRNNQYYVYSNAISGYIMYGDPATGNVGIGYGTTSYKLDVNGTIRATADVIAYSDARVKENVKTVEKALEKVQSLRGVTYTRKDIDDKSEKVGVIAQEVLEVLPQVVSQDSEGQYSVAYGNMVGVLIEAIKELKAEIDILKNK